MGQHTVTLRATKIITLPINDAPDMESATEFARLQVKRQFPIVEVLDIEDAIIVEEKTDATQEIQPDTQELPHMLRSIDHTRRATDRP